MYTFQIYANLYKHLIRILVNTNILRSSIYSFPTMTKDPGKHFHVFLGLCHILLEGVAHASV
mgnify:CR=1 FL=1